MSAAIVDPNRGDNRLYRFLRSIPTWVLWALVVVWLTPTLGLFVNSLRTRGQTAVRPQQVQPIHQQDLALLRTLTE